MNLDREIQVHVELGMFLVLSVVPEVLGMTIVDSDIGINNHFFDCIFST